MEYIKSVGISFIKIIREFIVIEIEEMTRIYADEVIKMMRIFYTSPAVHTNGSEEIFLNDVENCINDNSYLEGYVFVENDVVLEDMLC